jgi:hypothetical protein
LKNFTLLFFLVTGLSAFASKPSPIKRDACIFFAKYLSTDIKNQILYMNVEIIRGSALSKPQYSNCNFTGLREYRLLISIKNKKNYAVEGVKVILAEHYLPIGHPWLKQYQRYLNIEKTLQLGTKLLIVENDERAVGDQNIAVVEEERR